MVYLPTFTIKINQGPNAGKYTSPMDPMGTLFSTSWCHPMWGFNGVGFNQQNPSPFWSHETGSFDGTLNKTAWNDSNRPGTPVTNLISPKERDFGNSSSKRADMFEVTVNLLMYVYGLPLYETKIWSNYHNDLSRPHIKCSFLRGTQMTKFISISDTSWSKKSRWDVGPVIRLVWVDCYLIGC